MLRLPTFKQSDWMVKFLNQSKCLKIRYVLHRDAWLDRVTVHNKRMQKIFVGSGQKNYNSTFDNIWH